MDDFAAVLEPIQSLRFVPYRVENEERDRKENEE
jgi:hypothetical protein